MEVLTKASLHFAKGDSRSPFHYDLPCMVGLLLLVAFGARRLLGLGGQAVPG